MPARLLLIFLSLRRGGNPEGGSTATASATLITLAWQREGGCTIRSPFWFIWASGSDSSILRITGSYVSIASHLWFYGAHRVFIFTLPRLFTASQLWEVGTARHTFSLFFVNHPAETENRKQYKTSSVSCGGLVLEFVGSPKACQPKKLLVSVPGFATSVRVGTLEMTDKLARHTLKR